MLTVELYVSILKGVVDARKDCTRYGERNASHPRPPLSADYILAITNPSQCCVFDPHRTTSCNCSPPHSTVCIPIELIGDKTIIRDIGR